MPKLIASDIDGTLLPYGQTTLPEELFDLIRRLRARGILFCPASGRQYHSLRALFAPVADEICYLCENGAVVYGPGREDTAPLLSKTEIPREAALRLIREILALPGCEPLVSGVGTSFLFPGYGEALRRDLEHRLHNRVTVVRQPEEIGEAIVKVAAFCPESLEEPARLLTPRWQTQVHVAVAGKEWLDFTTADKGDGLRRLSTALGVPLAEIAAFGDNENDIAMLETAGEAWLMSAAAPALLRRFPRHCASVPPVLERYLAAQTPAQMENQSN